MTELQELGRSHRTVAELCFPADFGPVAEVTLSRAHFCVL